DVKGTTLASASTLDGDIKGKLKDKSKSEAAKMVGELAAKRAGVAGIKEVV
ncbi:MAG TPA: 50S ribosomal protein L18, partial [Clostridiales bacterium]|nr:50S ribosomal protein L18 [Clostridiales bacterium]